MKSSVERQSEQLLEAKRRPREGGVLEIQARAENEAQIVADITPAENVAKQHNTAVPPVFMDKFKAIGKRALAPLVEFNENVENVAEIEHLKKEIVELFSMNKDSEAWNKRYSERNWSHESSKSLEDKNEWLEFGLPPDKVAALKEAGRQLARLDSLAAQELLFTGGQKISSLDAALSRLLGGGKQLENSGTRILFCEAISEVVAEKDPVAAWEIFEKYNKQQKGNAYHNSGADWFDRVATPQNIFALIESTRARWRQYGWSQ